MAASIVCRLTSRLLFIATIASCSNTQMSKAVQNSQAKSEITMCNRVYQFMPVNDNGTDNGWDEMFSQPAKRQVLVDKLTGDTVFWRIDEVLVKGKNQYKHSYKIQGDTLWAIDEINVPKRGSYSSFNDRIIVRAICRHGNLRADSAWSFKMGRLTEAYSLPVRF